MKNVIIAILATLLTVSMFFNVIMGIDYKYFIKQSKEYEIRCDNLKELILNSEEEKLYLKGLMLKNEYIQDSLLNKAFNYADNIHR